MKQFLVAVALVAVCGAQNLPQLPNLPEFPPALTGSIPADLIQPVEDAYNTARGLIGDINTEITTIVPVLETVGEQGEIIIKGLFDLARVMATQDMTQPMSVLYMAKAGYPITQALVKAMESAKALHIPGLDALLVPLKAFSTTLGIIRCPVAPLECLGFGK